MSPETSVPAEPTKRSFRALKCDGSVSFIVPVNSHDVTIKKICCKVYFPIMNVNLLRRLIIATTCKGDDLVEKFVDLFKNQTSFVRWNSFHLLEMMDDADIKLISLTLSTAQMEIYNELKEDGKNQHAATPIVKSVIHKCFDKLLSMVVPLRLS